MQKMPWKPDAAKEQDTGRQKVSKARAEPRRPRHNNRMGVVVVLNRRLMVKALEYHDNDASHQLANRPAIGHACQYLGC